MVIFLRVVPLDLAMNLNKAAVTAGKTNIKMQVSLKLLSIFKSKYRQLTFYQVFKSDRELGHGKIYSAKDLPTIITNFFHT